jgi:hypothetical protein
MSSEGVSPEEREKQLSTILTSFIKDKENLMNRTKTEKDNLEKKVLEL